MSFKTKLLEFWQSRLVIVGKTGRIPKLFSELAMWYYIGIFFLSFIKNPLECVSTEHSLQNNLFFLIIPLCPVFLDSKSGENIQVAPGERNGPGIQERASPCSATRTLHRNSAALLSALHASSYRVDSQMPPGEVWDGPRRRTGSLLLYRPRSMPQHVFSPTLYCCLHPTLTAHRYVLVRPLWIQPLLLTCPLQQNILSRSRGEPWNLIPSQW